MFNGAQLGEWVYIFLDKEKYGFLMHIPSTGFSSIGLGKYGVDFLIDFLLALPDLQGLGFSPRPATSDMQNEINILGNKK